MSEQKIKVGMKIKITERDWSAYPSVHVVQEVEENQYNEYVPNSITTCCGVYFPTSASDGYWKDKSAQFSTYEVIEEEKIETNE